MNKPLVIYHASCADGFAAAFAAWLKLGDEAEYLPMQYGNVDIDLECVDREVFILDFSFPKVMMGNIFHAAKRVVWLDHHKTAFEMWEVPVGQRAWVENETHHVKLHMDKSGAMLAWEYFHPSTEVPLFIKHIDDYDRWVFALNGTKEFNKALWSYAPWSFEDWKARFIVDGGLSEQYVHGVMYPRLYTEGAAILRAHEQNVQSVVRNAARPCKVCIGEVGDWSSDFIGDVYNGLAANCPPHLASDVGHELATQSGTFGLLWTLGKDGMTVKCSLRSNPGYDVSAIAKAFGGGGHKNAAGFEVNIQTLLGWIK